MSLWHKKMFNNVQLCMRETLNFQTISDMSGANLDWIGKEAYVVRFKSARYTKAFSKHVPA
jgi:hypothetical protein